eukprot:COSAG05_NODE_951_length_6466_cov_130.129417_1_plen_166_part_00
MGGKRAPEQQGHAESGTTVIYGRRPKKKERRTLPGTLLVERQKFISTQLGRMWRYPVRHRRRDGRRRRRDGRYRVRVQELTAGGGDLVSGSSSSRDDGGGDDDDDDDDDDDSSSDDDNDDEEQRRPADLPARRQQARPCARIPSPLPLSSAQQCVPCSVPVHRLM